MSTSLGTWRSEQSSARQQTLREESTNGDEEPPSQRPWLLLVSGRPQLQQAIARAIGSTCHVVAVDQLRLALAAIGARRFQAAIVDLVLPDSSGRDALASVKRAAPELPIVFLTCLTDPIHQSQLARWGARAHVRLDGRQEISVERLYEAFASAGVAMVSTVTAGTIPKPASVSTT